MHQDTRVLENAPEQKRGLADKNRERDRGKLARRKSPRLDVGNTIANERKNIDLR